MKNLSIKSKLMFLSLTPIIAVILITLVLLNELKHTAEGVERIYADRVIPLEDLKVIADDYAVLQIDAINKANAGLMSAEDAVAAMKSSEIDIAQKWSKYTATELTKEEAQLAKQAEALFLPASRAIQDAINVLGKLSGNVAGQIDNLDGPLYSLSLIHI